jgi:hypothetical protein
MQELEQAACQQALADRNWVNTVQGQIAVQVMRTQLVRSVLSVH